MKQSDQSDKRSAIRRQPTNRANRLVLRRILVPLDFSGKSRKALSLAVPLAAQFSGKVSLVHVIDPVSTHPFGPVEIGAAPLDLQPMMDAFKERLSRTARELVPPELFSQATIRTGRAYSEIIGAADEGDADLIVIATHGFTGLKHVLLGSTAERVVRHAHCPVLTVSRRSTADGLPIQKKARLPRIRQQSGSRLPWRLILVPIDFSKTSLRALDVAVPLARDCGARLFLLSVIEPNAYATGMDGAILVIPDATLVADAKANLHDLAERFVPPEVPVTCLVKRGKAFDVITDFAQTKGMDLIVLTTHGHTGLDRMLMGSTAESVVRHSPCAVYVVRSFARTQSKRHVKGSKQ